MHRVLYLAIDFVEPSDLAQSVPKVLEIVQQHATEGSPLNAMGNVDVDGRLVGYDFDVDGARAGEVTALANLMRGGR